MVLIGITGGVATGKSLVARLFRQHGVPVADADEAARAATGPGTNVTRKVLEEFGESYRAADGSIDRRALGRLVFTDADARRRLEAIVHPEVERALKRQIEQWRSGTNPPRVAAVEVPLLFEVGWRNWFDRIVVVAADEATQIRRLASRDGLAAEEARRRMKAQMPLAAKAAGADYVVNNDGSEEETAAQVASILAHIRRA